MFKAKSLFFHRNGHHILRDLSFEVELGNCLIVRGPNGVGKSTLLRLIAGFIQPTSGSLSFNGMIIDNSLEFSSEHIEYIGHSDGVKKTMSIIETIHLWNRLYENPSSKRPSRMKISEIINRQISRCSAGQIKRFSLSRLELTRKKIWLLDEPTSAIDDISAVHLKEIIEQHCLSGGIAIVATHDDLKYGTNTELLL